MLGFLALLLSIIMLLVVWAIAMNVNRIQNQLDQWEQEVNARLKELSDQLSSPGNGATWTAEIKHKRGIIEFRQISAATESEAVAQLLRQGIDPARIKTLTRKE